MILLLWLLPFWLPLVAAGLALLPIRGRGWLLPIAAVPALAMGVVGSPAALPDLSWLLLDIRVSLDPLGQLLLAMTGFLWLAAGATARSGAGNDRGFAALWLVALAGNVGLLQAGDAVTFYSCFAVMTFAAYGLVVHDRSAGAMRAGRVYMAMAVVGEVAVFTGLVLATHAAGTTEMTALGPAVAAAPNRSLIIGLVLVGFGVKAGIIPLHVWLPLAHPAAPVPASAVLSGAMIKAGLIGWVRVLPLGEVTLPGWSTLLVVMGLLTAFGGVAVGLTQRSPKATLAYSSVSQMGLIAVIVGVGLATPEGAALAVGAAGVYALHHGLAKGALFLGVGVLRAESAPRRHRWLLAGMGVAALSLAGLPLTSGALAKIQLKAAVGEQPGLLLALSLAAAGTTALMGRLLLMLRAPAAEGRAPLSLLGPWLMVLAAVAVATWALPTVVGIQIAPIELYGAVLWDGLWPVLLGVGAVAAAQVVHRRTGATVGEIPPGDVVVIWERVGRRAAHVWRTRVSPSATAVGALVERLGDLGLLLLRPGGGVARAERFLTRWRTAGAIFVLLGMLMLALIVPGSAGR